MIVGYARLSKIDKSLTMQINKLKDYGCEKIFHEPRCKGKNNEEKVIGILNSLNIGDTFVTYKLSRLATSKSQLFHFINILKEKKIDFVSIQDNIHTKISEEKTIFEMLLILDEFEKDIVYEKKVSGLRTGRPRGRNGGRPKVDQQKLNQAISLYNTKEMSVMKIQEVTGISRTTLYRELRKLKRFS
ncbi:recombinase family protein [Priestia megaterium]|uniref:recombinase family protein n=1 Tax=Priestia megaterium TaxID=1404 RepID=UPI000BA7A1C1|nr:recombinase family protein [Priestia megaterium]PAK45367.1 resolvase [Priestia megaterium]